MRIGIDACTWANRRGYGRFTRMLVATMIGTKLGGKTQWRVNEHSSMANVGLPKSYWLYFLIVFLGVSAEWSVCFWCTEYLEQVLHFTRGRAAAMCLGINGERQCQQSGKNRRSHP